MSMRLEGLRKVLQENELDAILISTPENRRYLSGFSGSAGYLLISQAEAILCTDFRYVEQAGKQAPLFRVERIGGSGGLDWFPKLAGELKARRIGFEAQNLTVAAHKALSDAIQASDNGSRPELLATSALVDMIRAVKDQDELALMTRAVEIADQALEEVVAQVRPGMTETEIAWRLEKSMREKGAESISFDTIVGVGPNGALPHHHPDDTVVVSGQPIVIDMGAKYQGYCSDMTRTIVVGEPDETFHKVYDTVLSAQLKAEEEVRAGMSGGDIDAISRKVIEDAGYGDNFGHSLGHGIGLAVHEYPRVGPNAEGALEEGMVFTIEPGIYLSGWGGVRIEDMVVLENGRARVLTKAHKRSRV